MILVIDTTDRHIIKLGLVDKNIDWFKKETERQSEDLLIFLDSTLKNKKLKIENIDAILVNIGPGSFTGVRVGVTVANTLAWSLDIAVLGYRDGQINIVLDPHTNMRNLIKILKNNHLYPIEPDIGVGVDKMKTLINNKFSKIALPYYGEKQI